jgi:hypothetical protein
MTRIRAGTGLDVLLRDHDPDVEASAARTLRKPVSSSHGAVRVIGGKYDLFKRSQLVLRACLRSRCQRHPESLRPAR